MTTAKEWDDTSPPCRAGVFFPGIPTYLARIMHRLHVGVWRCMCVPTKCECGMSVSFHHVMFSCTSCSDHFQPLTGKLRSVGLPLCTKSLAVCDQREGWSLLRAAARLVYTCPLAAYLLIPATTTSVCLHTQVFLAASILLQVYLNYNVRLRRFLTVNTVCADCIYSMLCSPPT